MRVRSEAIEFRLTLLASLFVTSLVVSNLTASKLIAVDVPVIGSIVFPSAVLAYALTFTFTDIISEVWGKGSAAKIVVFGLVSNALALFLVTFSVILPAAPFQSEYASVFNLVFSFSPGIIVSSMIAYLISQFNDVMLFHKLKEATGGRHLWLRNNLSTMVSQFLDTLVFIMLAFYALPILVVGNPIIPFEEVPRLVLGQYIIKVLIAILDTPLVYTVVYLVKNSGKTTLTRLIR